MLKRLLYLALFLPVLANAFVLGGGGMATNATVGGTGWPLNTRSLAFNGVDKFLQIPIGHTLDFNYNQPWSVSFWVKPISLVGDYGVIPVISTQDPAHEFKGLYITLRSNGNVALAFLHSYPTDGVSVITTANGLITVNTWAHVGITYFGGAGGATNANLKIYTDGVSRTVGDHDTAGPLTASSTQSGLAMMIGKSENPYNTPFNGRMRELYFYSAALDASQMAALAVASVNPKTLNSSSNLISAYRMGIDTDTPSLVADQIGDNDAIPQNMVSGDFVSESP